MIIDNSIQEKLEKINSWISVRDIVALFLATLVLVGLLMFISREQNKQNKVVSYEETFSQDIGRVDDARPFGSKGGTTYIFSWCRGSTRILDKNKIYFTSEEHAARSGRTLSKMCQ
jgi:hypothetical protein